MTEDSPVGSNSLQLCTGICGKNRIFIQPAVKQRAIGGTVHETENGEKNMENGKQVTAMMRSRGKPVYVIGEGWGGGGGGIRGKNINAREQSHSKKWNLT